MMVRTDLGKLLAAARWVTQALPTRSVSPILMGILLEADEEAVTVSAYNNRVCARVRVAVETCTPGRMLLPGILFGKTLASLEADLVDIELEGSRASICAGGAGFRLELLTVEDYPLLPALPPARGWMTAEDFRSAVDQVSFATEVDGEINELRTDAVLLELDAEEITFVATDRYRVPVVKRPWNSLEATGESSSVLMLPGMLRGFAKASEGRVELAWPQQNPGVAITGLVGLTCGDYTLIDGMLGGKFPKWQNIPVKIKDADLTAEVDVKEFHGALKRAMVVLEENRPVQLTFMEGCLQVDSGTSESSMTEVIGADVIGDEMVCWFNPAYLLQALAASSTTRVVLHMNGGRAACLTGVSDPTGYRHILMPQRNV